MYDGGRIVQQKKYAGIVEATEEEIKKFLEEWNKPRIYYHLSDSLYEHLVTAVPVKVQDITTLQPYNPETRDWPDLPEGMDFYMKWDKDEQMWKDI